MNKIWLDCQGNRQPIGGSVKYLRSGFQGKLKQEARSMAPLDGGVATKGEGKDLPEQGDEVFASVSHDGLTKEQAG